MTPLGSNKVAKAVFIRRDIILAAQVIPEVFAIAIVSIVVTAFGVKRDNEKMMSLEYRQIQQ